MCDDVEHNCDDVVTEKGNDRKVTETREPSVPGEMRQAKLDDPQERDEQQKVLESELVEGPRGVERHVDDREPMRLGRPFAVLCISEELRQTVQKFDLVRRRVVRYHGGERRQ